MKCLNASQSQCNWAEKIALPFLSSSSCPLRVSTLPPNGLIGRFELNPEAAEFLQSLEGIKLGVVAVCGKYRTGKSYLLNKLFVETYFQNLNSTAKVNSDDVSPVQDTFSAEAEKKDPKNQTQGGGFQVSPTINPCTKGLWIWKKVIYSE